MRDFENLDLWGKDEFFFKMDEAWLNAPSLEMDAWLFLKRWGWWSLFFLKMNKAWPNAPSLRIDAWCMKTLIFEENMISFFFKMDETWPNSLSLEMDIWFWGNLDFFMKRWWWWFFQNGWGMAECPKFRNQCEFWKIFLCRDLNKENFE